MRLYHMKQQDGTIVHWCLSFSYQLMYVGQNQNYNIQTLFSLILVIQGQRKNIGYKNKSSS